MIQFQTDRERLAWIGAMIDAECHLGITNTHSSTCKEDGRYYLPRLECANTNRPLIEELHAAIGTGFVMDGKRKSRLPHWKQQWVYGARPSGLRILLPQVLPFLVAKRRQAELMIEALELSKDRRHKTVKERHAKLNIIEEEIKRLNHT